MRLLQRAAQAIEVPDHEDVALAEQGAYLFQPCSSGVVAAGDIDEELLTARLSQSVLLQIEVLLVGRDARVANQHMEISPLGYAKSLKNS